EIVGGGTGIVGGGTGSKTEIVGGGTGVEIVGGGTGIVGGGTGVEIVGGGTGVEIVGGGTGVEIVGGGTGSRTLIVGGGTGIDAVAVTVNGDLSMEITMSCGYADVYVLDSAGYEVITFNDVKVKGAASNCGGNWDHDDIVIEPGHVLQP
ncbi:MAG: hypothetical protein V2I57_14480, partial [Xanthomonadales bacterium]|nr:hypothetical protein [Xanthomonadales bacterium]